MTAREDDATRQLAARVPAELARAVRIAAAADGRSVQDIVATAVREWLARRDAEEAPPMTDFLRPCPACGADRAMGEVNCPACGASWRAMPSDARKGASGRRQARMGPGVQPGRRRGVQEPPRRPRTPAASAWIWMRALAWVAAGWLGTEAAVHLLHAHGL